MMSATFLDFFIPSPLSAFSRNLTYYFWFFSTPFPIADVINECPLSANLLLFMMSSREFKTELGESSLRNDSRLHLCLPKMEKHKNNPTAKVCSLAVINWQRNEKSRKGHRCKISLDLSLLGIAVQRAMILRISGE